MKSFKIYYQQLKLHPEASWKPMQFVAQWYHMDQNINSINCPHSCILHQLKLQSSLQWQPQVEYKNRIE